MKRIVFVATLLMTTLASAKTLRVAVVDTGLNLTDARFSGHLCSTGHKDFTGEGIVDTNGHGTSMVGLIEKFAKEGDYCLVIYKYYIDSAPGWLNAEREIQALEEAVKSDINIANLSDGGPSFNEKEYLAIKNNPEITFVVAAGNEGQDLDISGNEFYPASYYLKNEIVVKNVDRNNKKTSYSNYGKRVTVSEVGENVVAPTIYGNSSISGTSVSCAIHTGKLIRKTLDATK